MKDAAPLEVTASTFGAAVSRVQAHELHSGGKIEQLITINRRPNVVFSFWRNLENLPRFMRYLEDVRILSPTQSRWTWKTGKGEVLHWNVEIIAEIADRLISWRTFPGGDVSHAGSVWFHPSFSSETSTELHLQLLFHPQGSTWPHQADAAIASTLKETLDEDLHQLRKLLESGDVREVDPHESAGDAVVFGPPAGDPKLNA